MLTVQDRTDLASTAIANVAASWPCFTFRRVVRVLLATGQDFGSAFSSS